MSKLLIFDFDGTIADSLELVIELFYELTGRENDFNEEKRATMQELPLRQLIKVLSVRPWHVPLLLMRGRKKMAARLKEVKVFDDMPRVIGRLHEKGYRLLVVTSNSEENVRAFLRANGMEGSFEQVYGSVGLFRKKRLLKKIVRRSGMDTKDCWYVGDEARDVIAAHHAHIRIAAVSWGFNSRRLLEAHHPEAIAAKPSDLLRIL